MQQQVDRVTALAHQAAELLPEAPPEGDIDGYLGWRELVWCTAVRLSDVAGPSLADRAVGLEQPSGDAPVTAQLLLDLACLVGQPAGEALGSARPGDQLSVHASPLQTAYIARRRRRRQLRRGPEGRAACGLGAARKGVRRC